MKLLFDQNLSFRLCTLLATEFPGSARVRAVGFDRAEDRTICEYAKSHGFTIVSQDADDAEFAALRGASQGAVASMRQSANRFCRNFGLQTGGDITAFAEAEALACLEIY